MMNHNAGMAIWPHIDALRQRDGTPGSADAFRRRLAARLAGLEDVELVRLIDGIARACTGLRTPRHWAAASLRQGVVLGDGAFRELRAWVVAHGEQVWCRVIDDPDALADLTPDEQHPFLPPLLATPHKQYANRAARDPTLDARADAALGSTRFDSALDDHIGWQRWQVPAPDELAATLPRLWARHGARWRPGVSDRVDEQHELFGFVDVADVPGLGPVRPGDQLVRRHDGSTFEVLGIHDLALAFGASFAGAAALRHVARIREADGSVRCNQGLGGAHQYRPGTNPGPAPQPHDDADDAALDAWEAADAAIQARVATALGGATEIRVRYSAGPDDEHGRPVDNLDEIAHWGSVQFVEVDASDGERYESDVLINPTWLDVARVANEMMLALGYVDHVYLEGIEVHPGRKGKVARGEFLLGS